MRPRHWFARLSLLAFGLLLALLVPLQAFAAERVPILLDNDIGTDVDDAFAVALALASPELEVRGVTTVAKDAEDRAWMVCRMLTAVDRRDVPVAFGANPQPNEDVNWQIQYRRHPGVIFNRTSKPVKQTAVELLYEQLKADPGKITLCAVGPLTNVAALLKQHPECKPWIKRIVIMGGSVRVGYQPKSPIEVEWNIKLDPKAAQTVFTSGIPLVVAPLDATASLKLEEPLRRKLFAACTPMTYQIQALYQLWNNPTPTLFDPAAIALCFSEQFFTMEDLHLDVDDQGFTRIGPGEPNARVATAVKSAEFLDWYVERVSAGKPVLPKEPGNVSTTVATGKRPNRVHCFEDYETDIEQRWWMSGKVEKGPSGRICRSVLTQDFDDLQGDMQTMYAAVIFNPVPGPPMGKQPRLNFRYRLEGTDTLRIQIYSLTNGYHRYLSLKGLPQGRWETATVDMTQVRRPDGSGGPLAENERIDDVQFYVDPRAEVLIDDFVLYDAAREDETRPFPKSIQYTGWFDTGKQGKEWPGTFDIVEDNDFFWKAAKSVPNAEGQPAIRLSLRDERALGQHTELFFRYRLTGDGPVRVRLSNRHSKAAWEIELKDLKAGQVAMETAALFDKDGPPAGQKVDALEFLPPKGTELLVDDVLLYEPGKE
jgi:inosine-uridine nucleoside N-ribohydrolase